MWELVRFSKILLYERPYSVKGTIKLAGLKEAPKGICTARIIGTWKARNVEDILKSDEAVVRINPSGYNLHLS
jgi:hypothetical protein